MVCHLPHTRLFFVMNNAPCRKISKLFQLLPPWCWWESLPRGVWAGAWAGGMAAGGWSMRADLFQESREGRTGVEGPFEGP